MTLECPAGLPQTYWSGILRKGFTWCIVNVLEVPQILHFEPSLDASSLRSDVISSIKLLSLGSNRPSHTLRTRHLPCMAQGLNPVRLSLSLSRSSLPPLPPPSPTNPTVAR